MNYACIRIQGLVFSHGMTRDDGYSNMHIDKINNEKLLVYNAVTEQFQPIQNRVRGFVF